MDLLALYAAATPEKPALVDDHDGTVIQLTYAELDVAANRLANVLVDRGLGAGDKVAWCGQNSAGVVTLLCAAQRLGATAVPVNYRFTDSEATYVIAHSDATVVYVDAELAPMLARIRGELPAVHSVLVFGGAFPEATDGWFASADDLVANAPASAPPLGEGAGDGATMIYTSGTTGKPKGALRNVAALDPAAVGEFVALVGYSTDDVYITTGPLYHSGPLGFMTLAYGLGQTVVVQRKFDAEDWLRLVDTYRCTSTFSAPTPMRTICNLPADVLDRYDRSSMRIMIANAAPWSMALKRRYLEVFAPQSLFEVYGSTELSVNTILLPADQLRKPGSCGKEMPRVEIRLYDDEGHIVTDVGPQATGELYVRSGSVFDDYYKQSDKYAEDHRDGFQTVGDIAYRDEEGYLYICDRKRDMVISGGVNIYPAEIEAALELHPDIYEAAVFGIPSDEWGEAVHAVVVAAPGIGARRIPRSRRRRRSRPSTPCRVQGAPFGQLAQRAAQDGQRQDPQARAAAGILVGGTEQRVSGDDFRSGFVTMVGRPNVGKSSLINAICGSKVSIVSDKPQTTRHRVRGVYNRPDAQLVFVDTPGLHKAVTALGERVNATALESLGEADDVDVVCLVLDATTPFGSGDRWVAERVELSRAVVVVNKTDRASREQVLAMLGAAAELAAESYFPVSAKARRGLDELVDHLVARAPFGPPMFPADAVRDVAEEVWVAELVREQLLAVTRDELPYSIATRVSEWEGNRVTVEIVVERESQKGMVIGKQGAVLKQVGERARAQLPAGTYLDLRVKVDKDWQRRPDRVERLGY